MSYKAIKNDEVEDLQRRVAFAETCADPTNFDQLLNRVCSLLNKWAQADVVTLILPPEEEGLEPMLHVFGQQPILPTSERSIRDDTSALLAELEYADLPGDALRLRRGAELTPLHGVLRDDYMYRFWWQELKLDGQTVGIVSLYGFIDWVLSPRIRRLLGSMMTMLATAINNAASVENLRLQSDRDELTGTLNQRGIFDALDRECARSETFGHELSVLLCEIEGLTDVVSPVESDAALQAFTELALTLDRGFDQVGRIANNEFVFVLPQSGPDMTSALVNEIEESSRQILIRGEPMSVAIGQSQFAAGATAETLLQGADESLFSIRRQRALSAPAVG